MCHALFVMSDFGLRMRGCEGNLAGVPAAATSCTLLHATPRTPARTEEARPRELFFDFVQDAGSSAASGGFWEQAPPVVVSLLSRASMDAVDTLSNASSAFPRDPVTGVYANTQFTSPLYPQYRRSDVWQVMTGAPASTVIIPSLVVTDTATAPSLARTSPQVVGIACGDETYGSTGSSGWWDAYAPCASPATWFSGTATEVVTPNTAPAAPSAGRVAWAASTITLTLGQGPLPATPSDALATIEAPPAPPKYGATLPLTLTIAGRTGKEVKVLVTLQVVPMVQPPLPADLQQVYGGIDSAGRFPLSVTPGYVELHWVASPPGSSAAAPSQPGTIHVDVAVPADANDWLLYRSADTPDWVTAINVQALGDTRVLGADRGVVKRVTITVDASAKPAGFSDHITLAMSPNVTGVDGSGILVDVDGTITVETLPPTPLSFTAQLTVLSSIAAPDEASLFTSLVPEGNTSRVLRFFNTGRLPVDYRMFVDSHNALVAAGNPAGWLEMGGAVDSFTRVGYGVVQPYSEVRIPLNVLAPGNTTTPTARKTDLVFDANAHFVGTDGVQARELDSAGNPGSTAVAMELESVDTPSPRPVSGALQLTIPVSLQVSLYTIWPQEAVFTLSPESSDVIIFELLNMAPIYNLELVIAKSQGSPEWLKILLPAEDPDGKTRVTLTTDGRLGSMWLQGANVPGVTGQPFPNHLLEPGVYKTAVEITSRVLPDSPGYSNLDTTPGLGSEVREVPVTLNVVVGAAAPETTELHPDRPLNPTYKVIANDAGPHQLELRLRDRYGFGPPVPTIPEVSLLSTASADTVGVGDIDVVVQPVVGGEVTVDIIPTKVGRVAVEVSLDGAPVEGHVRSPILVEVLPAQCDVAADGEPAHSAQHVLSANGMECLCSAGWERVNLGDSNATVSQAAALDGESSPVSGELYGGVFCQPCREGYFKSVPGNTVRCSPCGDGKFSRSDGIGCDDCPNEGVLCVAGNLQLVRGFWCETCLVEDDVTPTMVTAAAARLNKTALSLRNSRSLQEVAPADDDTEAAVVAELTSNEVSTGTSFFACIPEEACEPARNNTAVQCREGHSGILCSECEEGWAKSNPQGLCSECWPSAASVSLSALLFSVMFGLVCYIALKKPSSGDSLTTALLRIASTWAQLASLLLTARLPPRSILDDVITVLGDVAGGVPLQSNPVQCTFGELVGFYTRFNLFLSLPFICVGMGLLLGGLYLAYRLATAPAAPADKDSDAASLQSARSDIDIDDAASEEPAAPGQSAPGSLPSGAPVGEPSTSDESGADGLAGEPLQQEGQRPQVDVAAEGPTMGELAAPAVETPSTSQVAGDAPVDEGEPTLWAAVRQRASRATLVLLFLAHFAVTKACLLLLDVFDEPLFGAIRFRSDLRHGEFDDEFDSSQALATTGLVAFGIGLPVAAVVLLYFYRYELDRSFTRDTFGFLYVGYRLGPGTRMGSARASAVLQEVQENDAWSKYRPKACGGLWQWLLGDDDEEFSDDEDELGETMVGAHIVHPSSGEAATGESKAGAAAAGASLSAGEGDSDGEDGDPIPAGGVASKTGAIITDDEAAALSNTGYYAWEAVIVARKILMTTVSVTVRAPFTQSALMVMILTGSLCLHVSQMPYSSLLLNSAETLALIVLWISAMSGVVLYEGGELGDETAESVRALIVFSNVVLMMYFAFIVLYALSAAVRRWAISQYTSFAKSTFKAGGSGTPSLASWGRSAWGSTFLSSPPRKQQQAFEAKEGEAFHPGELKEAPPALASAAGEELAGHTSSDSDSDGSHADSTPQATGQAWAGPAPEHEVVVPVKP